MPNGLKYLYQSICQSPDGSLKGGELNRPRFAAFENRQIGLQMFKLWQHDYRDLERMVYDMHNSG